MRRANLVNYALYQIGWYACVLGGASHRPWTGFAYAIVLVALHLALSVERSLEVRLVGLATAVGAVVEMMQIARDALQLDTMRAADHDRDEVPDAALIQAAAGRRPVK